MGPQPFGCGRDFPRPSIAVATSCFNGAATFRLRKGQTCYLCRHVTRRLQWGRNLSVAEGLKPPILSRSAPDASMGPQPFGCGRALI